MPIGGGASNVVCDQIWETRDPGLDVCRFALPCPLDRPTFWCLRKKYHPNIIVGYKQLCKGHCNLNVLFLQLILSQNKISIINPCNTWNILCMDFEKSRFFATFSQMNPCYRPARVPVYNNKPIGTYLVVIQATNSSATSLTSNDRNRIFSKITFEGVMIGPYVKRLFKKNAER